MNMKNITNEDPYDKANKIFAQFDKNNDGKVSKGKIDLLNLLIFLINPLKF